MDCCKTLQDIERQCGGAAAPGLSTKAWIACTDQVESIPDKDDYDNGVGDPHTISQDIVLVADDPDTEADDPGQWFCWNFSRTDATYVAEPQGDNGEDGWLVTLSFYIPKLNALSTYILNNTAGGDFLVVYTDKCGNRRLLGDLICGGVAFSVREQTNDKNGYVVTGTWTTSVLPCWYTGAIQV